MRERSKPYMRMMVEQRHPEVWEGVHGDTARG